MNTDDIIGIISRADDDSVVEAWNEMCMDTNRTDDAVWTNDNETYETLFGGDIDAALRAAFYGDFRYTDDYCCLDGYGNLQTFNGVGYDNCPIYVPELADWLAEDPDRLAKWFGVEPDEEGGDNGR